MFARDYRYTDVKGRYRVDQSEGPGTTSGESVQPWQGTILVKAGRCWRSQDWQLSIWVRQPDPGNTAMASVHARLDALSSAGLIDWTQEGYPRIKRYLAASKGEAASDFIGDVQNVNNRSKEHIGYPTQKPLALLERIIAASSNPGDMVLDPFAGCATACVAAEKLGRQWSASTCRRRRRACGTCGFRTTWELFHNRLVTARRTFPSARTSSARSPPQEQARPVRAAEAKGNGCRNGLPIQDS